MKVDDFARLSVLCLDENDRSSFGPQPGSGISEKHLYVRTSTGEWTYWGNNEHTGVVLVSRCGCLSFLIRSPHFLQTSSAYNPGLEHLEARFLYVS